MGGRGSYSKVGGGTLSQSDFNKIVSAFGSDVFENPSQEQIELGKSLGLTENEVRLLHSYTYGLYEDVNGNIYTNKNGITTLTKDKLNRVLNKLDSFNGTTYRGFRTKNAEAYLSKIEKAGTFKYETFTSSSKSLDIVKRYARNKGDIRFIIKSKSGKAIRRLSAAPGEDEVLFKAGTRFKFKSKTLRNGFWYVNIIEI